MIRNSTKSSLALVKLLALILILVLTISSCEHSVTDDRREVQKPFSLPPSSMEKTLLQGDYKFVVKSNSDSVQQINTIPNRKVEFIRK